MIYDDKKDNKKGIFKMEMLQIPKDKHSEETLKVSDLIYNNPKLRS